MALDSPNEGLLRARFRKSRKVWSSDEEDNDEAPARGTKSKLKRLEGDLQSQAPRRALMPRMLSPARLESRPRSFSAPGSRASSAPGSPASLRPKNTMPSVPEFGVVGQQGLQKTWLETPLQTPARQVSTPMTGRSGFTPYASPYVSTSSIQRSLFNEAGPKNGMSSLADGPMRMIGTSADKSRQESPEFINWKDKLEIAERRRRAQGALLVRKGETCDNEKLLTLSFRIWKLAVTQIAAASSNHQEEIQIRDDKIAALIAALHKRNVRAKDSLMDWILQWCQAQSIGLLRNFFNIWASMYTTSRAVWEEREGQEDQYEDFIMQQTEQQDGLQKENDFVRQQLNALMDTLQKELKTKEELANELRDAMENNGRLQRELSRTNSTFSSRCPSPAGKAPMRRNLSEGSLRARLQSVCSAGNGRSGQDSTGSLKLEARSTREAEKLRLESNGRGGTHAGGSLKDFYDRRGAQQKKFNFQAPGRPSDEDRPAQ